MTQEAVTSLDKFPTPFGREMEFQDVRHESGLRMLRVRIREGRRFTILDLDAPTVAQCLQIMTGWTGDGADAPNETKGET